VTGDSESIHVDLGRRHFRRAVAVGVAIGTLIAAWIGTAGSFDLLRWEPLSDFYDAQAAAWLDGRWDIGVDILGVESFFRFDDDVAEAIEQGWPLDEDPLVADEILRSQPAYMYQGPVPALLRLPTSALAPELSGRLTLLWILVGTVVAGWSTGTLTWEVRRQLRPSALVTRGETAAVAALCALVTGGSSLVYLAAKPWVYHEALVWGVALCLSALVALARYIDEPSRRRLTVVGVLVTACLLTRASVGLGPLLGVAVLCAGQAAALARGTSHVPSSGLVRRALEGVAGLAPVRRSDASALGHLVGLVGVGSAALGSYALVNYVKFETLFSIPFDAQLHTLVDPTRQEFLAVNGGFFSLRFVPTTIVQYFRPDAFRFSELAPWIEFAPAPGRVIADARFDLFDRTASIPSAMPVFVLLGILAVVAAWRGWFATGGLRTLRVPLVAAAGAGAAVLPFGYIANRYIADFVPFMVIAAAIGLQALLTMERGRAYRVAVTGLVAAGLFGAWLNISHGLLMQRVYGITTDEERTAAFLSTQDRLSDRTGGDGLSSRLHRGDDLPAGSTGDLFVVGDCDAMYFQDGNPPNTIRPHSWIPVERTEAGGRHAMAIRFAESELGTRSPIFSGVDDEGTTSLLVAETTADGEVVFEYSGAGLPRRSAPVAIDPDHTYSAVLVVDHRLSKVSLSLDGRMAFDGFYAFEGPITIGRDLTDGDAEPEFGGAIERLPADAAALCHRLVDAEDRQGPTP
jgi:hypothetical protein